MQDLAERRLTHFVGGAWRAPLSQRMAGGARGRMVLAGPADLARAVAAATAAAAGWAALGAGPRAALLAAAGLEVPEMEVPEMEAAPPGASPTPLLRFSLPPAATLARQLARGRTLVLVTPRATPPALLGLIEALDHAGLPPGVLNLLNGSRADLPLSQGASAPP